MSLSLVCLNVEHSKHLDKVLPFLAERQPDVTCVQELSDADIPQFEAVVGSLIAYEPMSFRPNRNNTHEGPAIFSRHPVDNVQIRFYRGEPRELPPFDMSTPERKYETENGPFIWCDVPKGGVTYRVGTTHFTWTPDGTTSDLQRIDLKKLLPILEEAEELVFCGDFNAPRGGEIFDELAARYKDNIPPEYDWSLDLSLHRAGGGKIQEDVARIGLPGLMVDGLFTTPDYRAHGVSLVSGVSDHMAIVATIEKA
jgi:endonuclease/exonuclease/phosphatase family metal-dependent hydrolase